MSAQRAGVRGRWWITPLIMLVGGSGLTAASVIGGHHKDLAGGIAIVVVATVVFALIGRTRTDLGAMVASAHDERQRGIDVRATATAGVVMAVVLIVGAMVTLAQGHSGQPWIGLCAAFGVAYAVSLLIFRNR